MSLCTAVSSKLALSEALLTRVPIPCAHAAFQPAPSLLIEEVASCGNLECLRMPVPMPWPNLSLPASQSSACTANAHVASAGRGPDADPWAAAAKSSVRGPQPRKVPLDFGHLPAPAGAPHMGPREGHHHGPMGGPGSRPHMGPHGGQGPRLHPTDNSTFLRGVQATNASGFAVFQTIFPGPAPHEPPHINVKVCNLSQCVRSAVSNGSLTFQSCQSNLDLSDPSFDALSWALCVGSCRYPGAVDFRSAKVFWSMIWHFDCRCSNVGTTEAAPCNGMFLCLMCQPDGSPMRSQSHTTHLP